MTILCLFTQKENPRPEWGEGVVIRHYFVYFALLSFFNAGFGNVNFDVVPAKGIGIVHADGFIGLNLIGHGDKGKAFGQAAVSVFDQFHGGDFPSICEQGVDFCLGG
jgi:hypothetical protein